MGHCRKRAPRWRWLITNEESVRSAAKELVSAGHQALAIRCDVANEHQVAAMVEQTVSKF